MATSAMRERVPEYIGQLQGTIVAKLETYGDPCQKFRRTSWVRDEGGGGPSYTFSPPASDDHPIEKAGVNISAINGILPPAAVKQMSTAHAALKHVDQSLAFFAGGLSLIIHPRIPGVHANYRYFAVLDASSEPTVLAWWFGLITDLTPSYVDQADFRHCHSTLKTACDTWSDTSNTTASVYPAFKASCDDYLFIPHRHEYRGIGGVRFDEMDSDTMCALLRAHPGVSEETITRLRTQGALFSLVRSFLSSFIGIMERYMHESFVPPERRWQLLRRGRTVEFNLLADCGTKFGLGAPGIKAENVLVGMPPEVRWEYCSGPEDEDQNTPEVEMAKILNQSRGCIGYTS